MTKFCVAHGCYNRSNKVESREKKISFHRFPLKDPFRLKAWVMELKRENFVPNKHSLLCSDHFTEEDFIDNPSLKSGRKLKVNSIPRKFTFPKPFGKRKRISYQLLKLQDTIVQHAPEESQLAAIDIGHAPPESQPTAIATPATNVVQHAPEESKLAAIAKGHAPQESQLNAIAVHHASYKSDTIFKCIPLESESEATTGHYALEESKSEAAIIHNINQEYHIPYGSQTDIHLQGLSRDISRLLVDKSSCDILLSCGDKTFSAHRIILKMRSKAFSAILKKSPMTKGQNTMIRIEGYDAFIFQGFLQYLYTGRVPELNQKTAMQFYDIAKKYIVLELKEASADFLAKNVSPATVCETLVFAVSHKDQDFRKNVISSIIDKKIPESDGNDWFVFCKTYPGIAIEIMLLYIRHYRLSYKG